MNASTSKQQSSVSIISLRSCFIGLDQINKGNAGGLEKDFCSVFDLRKILVMCSTSENVFGRRVCNPKIILVVYSTSECFWLCLRPKNDFGFRS